MKKFRAADGRLVTAKVTEEQAAENELLGLVSIVMPLMVIVLFAACSGMI